MRSNNARREREKAKLRKAILDAALEIISSEGFAALSMRRLAARVQYSPAALYMHYKSREELAQALRHHGWQLLLQGLTLEVADSKGRDALYALGSGYVRFALAHSELYRLMFMSEQNLMRAAYMDVETDSVLDETFALLLRVVSSLISPALRSVSPHELADVVWSSLHGLLSLHLTLPGLQETAPLKQCGILLFLIADSFNGGPSSEINDRQADQAMPKATLKDDHPTALRSIRA